MPEKRLRTESTYEEKNVSEFVSSCASFTSNVSFVGVGDDAVIGPTVALIGTTTELAALDTKALPIAKATIDRLISQAVPGSIFATAEGEIRLLLGVVPTQSSRHNCPTRPDVITSLAQAALDDPLAKKGLDIVVGSTELLCIATAIARGANKKFSAKVGNDNRGYLSKFTPIRVHFPVSLSQKQRVALAATVDSVQLCQVLVDAPTNLLDTTTFAELAQLYGETLGFDVEILRGEALREKGYGGIYGVGKAAEFPPALAILSYNPNGGITPEKKLAFVGKGIVYDTGGLGIKTPKNLMCGMKRDMGGAAAVFTSFLAAVRMNVTSQVTCLLCLADNAIGPRSQRNDDIVRMKSGLTVEVNNTDAEGRLVLGDGVFHASALLPYTPDVIVDMATLTGAQGVATGKYHAAIYSNSGEYEVRTQEAGRKCGDLVFPVVYCPEFHNKEFSSKVADYKNSVANVSNAQVSCASQFIGNNLASDFGGAWVHVDLAAPATRDEATGFGVALALQLFFADHFAF
ncbi:aminopeptidase, putative [Bodo saltans]|uniref:Aminopeptidase, putative n=1 Tax=Bodo saltans TaxID=75058 RepID=A0A0S4IQ79_BODSA|nr:aminopeptidase, putative [Bodo saltans]|eukprot:CUF09577.1 aminopeptidase, putative [Bodo saltans]